MTGWRLYWDLHGRGVRLRVRGDRIQASGVLTAADRVAIQEHREELYALIERLEERAAIREFDGGFPRPEVERLAEADCRAAFTREGRT